MHKLIFIRTGRLIEDYITQYTVSLIVLEADEAMQTSPETSRAPIEAVHQTFATISWAYYIIEGINGAATAATARAVW